LYKIKRHRYFIQLRNFLKLVKAMTTEAKTEVLLNELKQNDANDKVVDKKTVTFSSDTPGIIKIAKMGLDKTEFNFKFKNLYSKYGAKKWDESQQPKITFNRLDEKEAEMMMKMEKNIIDKVFNEKYVAGFEGKADNVEVHDSIYENIGYHLKTTASRFCTYWKRDKKNEKVEVSEKEFMRLSGQMNGEYNVMGCADIVWYNVKDMKMGVKFVLNAIVFNGVSKKFKKTCPV
jgi:hypothetical protein